LGFGPSDDLAVEAFAFDGVVDAAEVEDYVCFLGGGEGWGCPGVVGDGLVHGAVGVYVVDAALLSGVDRVV